MIIDDGRDDLSRNRNKTTLDTKMDKKSQMISPTSTDVTLLAVIRTAAAYQIRAARPRLAEAKTTMPACAWATAERKHTQKKEVNMTMLVCSASVKNEHRPRNLVPQP